MPVVEFCGAYPQAAALVADHRSECISREQGTATVGHVLEIGGDDVREIADRVVRFCSFLLYDSGRPFPRGNARVHTNIGESWNKGPSTYLRQ